MPASVGHRQGLGGEALAVADLAGHGDIGQEVHLHTRGTLALAGRAMVPVSQSNNIKPSKLTLLEIKPIYRL